MKTIVITSGGTSEKIDNVRKITNSSSGKLGMTIANYLLKTNDDITIYYVCSKTSLRPLNERVDIIEKWIRIAFVCYELKNYNDFIGV